MSTSAEIIKSMSEGFATTLTIFIVTLVVALPLGLFISFGSMSKIKIIKYPTRLFIWIIRGVPLMLQIIAVFWICPLIFGYGNYRITAALIAFSINYACYFSEIFRAGITSVPLGQYEAGKVLGMKGKDIFTKVVLKQSIKRIVPPMSNEIITLVKDTALANIISVTELILVAKLQLTKGIIWPLFATGIYYLVFVGLLTIIFEKIEKKLAYF